MLGLRMGIDFGSTSFAVFVEGRGVVMNEPSVAVIDKYSGKTLAWGAAAKTMSEKLPDSMSVVYPIKDGIVTDRTQANVMLRNCINKVCFGKLFRPNILMCVPGTVTPLQKKTVFDVVMSAGAGKACFVDETLASAIGAGVSLTEKKGTMICDIGGGVTNCSIVSMGNIAVTQSLNIGGNDFTNAIIDYVSKKYKVEIGRATAEEVKVTLASAIPGNVDIALIICGKNTENGLPVQIEITANEIYEVLRPRLESIVSLVVSVLENSTPELCGDIADNGIILTGGSARIFGIDKLIQWKTNVKTVIAGNPQECAARGLGILLKDMKYLDRNGYVFRSVTDEEEESGE